MKTKVIDSNYIRVERNSHSETPSYQPLKSSNPAKANSASQDITIFLVDDDIMFLTALKHSITIGLTHYKIKIKTFQIGEEALAEMHSNPTIVILDYYLNSKVQDALDGLDVLKKIKKNNPRTKVIMLSSQDSLDVAISCVENKAFDYVSKNESAFVRINNIISNVIEDLELNSKGFKLYQVAIIIIFIMLVISLLFKL